MLMRCMACSFQRGPCSRARSRGEVRATAPPDSKHRMKDNILTCNSQGNAYNNGNLQCNHQDQIAPIPQHSNPYNYLLMPSSILRI